MASPTVINSRYEVRGIVGRGGMGLVYKAYDRVVGREVALKTLLDIQGRTALEMFYKEWRILANLHHPNIVEIFDIGEFQDGGEVKPFFVMPLLPGTTLEHVIHVSGPHIPPDRLVEIISQTCRGLQAIHDAGLVHRDIKPSNIFVMEQNSVKLIDFGVVHLLGGDTNTGIKGTLSYMSPEQIRNQECTNASDIFSLGVVCYEALCGVRPFQGSRNEEVFEAILHQTPPPIYEVNPAIGQTLSRAVHKALAKEARHRYRTCLEFADTLQRALRGEPIPVLDTVRIQPRIERAIRAFEQGNYQMATDILSDLEAAGHIDPALKPLRNQINQALRTSRLRELVDRAKLGLEEEEFTLALQSAEAALKMDPGNVEAGKLRGEIQAQMARLEVEECLREAERSIGAFAYGRARQLLRKALELQPDDSRATALLETLEAGERAYRAARQEKEDLYRAAREASQNFEFNAAAAKLERVLELEARAPDTSSPESVSNYTNFLSLVRSAQQVIENTRTSALEYMAAGDYERAIELCRSCMAKFPGHTVPQGLALLAESEQRRVKLIRVADLARAIEQEPRIDRKLDLLRRAVEICPDEPLFVQWMEPVKEQAALSKVVADRARVHEENGRFQEALEQLRFLNVIDPQRAGLAEEIQRVSGIASDRSAPTVALGQAAGMASSSSVLAEPISPRTAPTAAPTPIQPASSQPATKPIPPPPPPAPPIKPPVPEKVSPSPPPNMPPAPAKSTIRPAPGAPQKIQPPKPQASMGHSLRRNRLLYGTGAAAILLIVFAVAYTSLHKPQVGPAKPSAASRVKIVLRAGTPGATIRLGSDVASGELQTQLPPGPYVVDSELAGYQPYSGPITVGKDGLTTTLPTLLPWPLALHIATDVQNAKIALDGNPPQQVTDGMLNLDVSPGSHTITMAENSRQARFEFVSADAKAPELKDPITASNLLAFAISGYGSDYRVQGPAISAAAIEGGAAGAASPGHFEFTGLPNGPHQVTIKAGADDRSFPIESGPRPALWIALYSDRNVGALQVNAGLDQFQVFIDGVPYSRRIQNKAMWITNLSLGPHKLRVTADGYEAPPERVVDVKKGSASEAVALTPIPQAGALQVRGAPQRTQVFIDGFGPGIVDAEGNYSNEHVQPGDHSIELRNPPQYKNKTIPVTIAKGGTRTLAGAEVRLERNPAAITVKGTPEGANVEFRCGEGGWKNERAPVRTDCADARFTYRVSMDGYASAPEKTVSLNGGEPSEQIFELKRNTSPVVSQPKTAQCVDQNLAGHGWMTADKDWFQSGAGASLPCGDMLGTYEFEVRLPRGLFSGKPSVIYQAANGSGEFSFDKKSFSLGNKPKKDLSSYENNGTVKFRIVVDQSRIEFEAGKDSWVALDSASGDFRKLQFRFPSGLRISQFSFRSR